MNIYPKLLFLAVLASLSLSTQPIRAADEVSEESEEAPSQVHQAATVRPNLGQKAPQEGQGQQDPNITFLHDVEYGKAGDHVLHMEIAMPKVKPDKPMPAVLYFHPGGFVEGTHKSIPIAFLAKRGYFVGSVEYRFSNEAIFPAQLQDAQLAVRWLRANAKQYNVDPKRIAAWGGSAGAIIAQWLGTMRHSDGFAKAGGLDDVDDSVQAVVSFFGAADATLGYRIGKISVLNKNAIAMHGGRTYKDDPEGYKRSSSITFVKPDDPPFFLVYGALDKVCIPEQGEEMDKALSKANVPHELIIAKNAGHMFNHPNDAPPIDPPPLEIRKKAVDFLARYLLNDSKTVVTPKD